MKGESEVYHRMTKKSMKPGEHDEIIRKMKHLLKHPEENIYGVTEQEIRDSIELMENGKRVFGFK